MVTHQIPSWKRPQQGPVLSWVPTLLTSFILALPISSLADKKVEKKATSKVTRSGSPKAAPTLTSSISGLATSTNGLRGNPAITNPMRNDRSEMVVVPLPPGSSESPLTPPPFRLPNGPVTTIVTQASSSKAAKTSHSPLAPPQADKPLLDRIRYEIKQRLYVFQSCALTARRRGVECRRVDATWNIAADGTIKSIVFTNVPDPLFALCLQRIENQPLLIKPGMELKIPTPIVFVR